MANRHRMSSIFGFDGFPFTHFAGYWDCSSSLLLTAEATLQNLPTAESVLRDGLLQLKIWGFRFACCTAWCGIGVRMANHRMFNVFGFDGFPLIHFD